MRILIAFKHLELLEFKEYQKNLKVFDPALLSLPINWGHYGARAHNQGNPGNFRGRGPKQRGPTGQNTVKYDKRD